MNGDTPVGNRSMEILLYGYVHKNARHQMVDMFEIKDFAVDPTELDLRAGMDGLKRKMNQKDKSSLTMLEIPNAQLIPLICSNQTILEAIFPKIATNGCSAIKNNVVPTCECKQYIYT